MGSRERILQRIEGRTLNDLFMQTAADHGPRDALVDKQEGHWRRLSWSDYRQRAAELCMALRRRGVDRDNFVALMLKNRPEHAIADVASMLAGATPVSVYNTLAPDQLRYIADNCEAKVAIVEDRDLLERWLQVRDELPALELLVVVDPGEGSLPEGVVAWDALIEEGAAALTSAEGEFENTWRAARPDDPATIIYTSGTTGPPKGVVLTHANVLFQLYSLEELLDVEIEPGMTQVSYLPLAHIAERMTTHYRGMQYGSTVYFVREIADVLETLLEARPNVFMAVPRVWEKVHAALMAKINAEPNDRKRKLALAAIETGRHHVATQQRGERPGLGLTLRYRLFDRLVFSKIRHGIGLDRCEYPISGAAPISRDLLEFYAAIGLPIIEVYGMTESTAVITANRPGAIRIGTVGQAIPGTEIRIADDGEILARGPHITPGYWRREEATAEAIDSDGWLHTGDLGRLDDDGYLTIVGRKKELIVTAGGKNISPNNIEETIKQQSPLIGQLCAIGDERPFISALVVLDTEVLPAWAEAHGITAGSVAELAEHPAVEEEIARAIAAGNQHLSRVEQVKRWAILPTEWTAESEELTPTLKLKRSVIHSKYSDVIDGLYTTGE